MKDKFIIIDGNSCMHRAYHALPLLSKNGVYTNAVYGFLSMLIGVAKEYDPKYLAVCFDKSKKVFRHDLYPEYKAGRKSMDDELRQQFPLIKQVLQNMNIRIIEQEGFEADDIIGSLCLKFDEVITMPLTGDKDELQLVDENTVVMLMRKGISNIELFDMEHFFEVYGLEPNKFVDVKALMGDKSDNIPGVKSIGEKTALALISEYGSVENLYENIDSIKGKKQEALKNEKDIAFLSKVLATIKIDMVIDDELTDFKFSLENLKNGFQIINELGMNSLISRLGKKEDVVENTTQNVDNFVDKVDNIPEIICVKTINELKNYIKPKSEICLFENEDNLYISDGVYNIILDIKPTLFNDTIDYNQVIDIIKQNNCKVIIDDAKKIKGLDVVFDLGLAAYLVDSDGKDYSMKSLLEKYNGCKNVDGYSLLFLKKSLEKRIEPFKNVYYNIELPLTKVLCSMEDIGFGVDKDELYNIGKEYEQRLLELEYKIFDIAKSEFNVNSPKQLSKVLFEDLGLKPGKKTKTGYSTDVNVLEGLIDDSPIIELLLEHRTISKLKGTYVDGFLPLIDSENRVHTEFLQRGTATGRIASKEPNLQNIPVRSEEGRRIRNAFVARQGYTLICSDYSQIELRVLAHISNDEVMIDAFNKNQDIHTRTASEIFGCKIDEVTKEMRRDAKAVNFGIVYGLSPFGLSTNLKISVAKAKQYIDGYLQKYSGVRTYMNDIIQKAKKDGYVTTMFGRRRYIDSINSTNKNIAAFGQRIALNTPIQGSAADIIKTSMIQLYQELEKTDSRLIMQVHDELIVEAKKEETDKICGIIKKCMENVTELCVPLTVDIAIDDRWKK